MHTHTHNGPFSPSVGLGHAAKRAKDFVIYKVPSPLPLDPQLGGFFGEKSPSKTE
jgi:hypothetical protein